MDYEYLKNKEVKISNRSIKVKKIEEKCVNPFSKEVKYLVNGDEHFSARDIGMALSRLKRQEKESENANLGFIAKLLEKFGIFVWKYIYLNETRYGTPFGFRRYADHRAAFYVELNLGKFAWNLELVFNNKEEYENGVMPFVNCPLKKVV